jgi:hypothetical protein
MVDTMIMEVWMRRKTMSSYNNKADSQAV